ncbi:MAG: HAMP domain-containing sensor histidine kinase [Aquabacterium sp.]
MVDDASHFSAADHSEALIALKRELEERDDLLALLTHELRNPLHAILLQLEVARIGVQTEDPGLALGKLTRLRTSLQRYSRRVTVLLDLMARKDGYPTERKTIDLAQFLSELVEPLRLQAGFHRIELRYVSPPEAILAEMDPVVLEQIVENLLLNAFKHSGGTEVVMTLRASDGSKGSGSGNPR